MNGNHIPIQKGQSEEDAINEFIGSHYESELKTKTREYKSYYLYDTTKEDFEKGLSAATGVSKREYEKALKAGREGYERPFETSFYHRIPEDIEDNVFKTLESMGDVNSPEDFERKLRQNLFKYDGINADNYQTIRNAFDDEISETYNILIAPKLDVINNIDIDNSYEVFNNSFKTSNNVTENFKQKIMDNFEKCKDEDCKIMLAVVSETGTKFSQNLKEDIFGNRIGTCYQPRENNINILDDDNDLNTLYHEGFHSVFERYNVKDTNLKAVMKKELNHSEKINSIYEYFENEYTNEMGFSHKNVLIQKREELRNRMNDLYNKVLNESAKKFGGLKTADVYADARKTLRENHPEYSEWDSNFWKIVRGIDAIEKGAENKIIGEHPDLADIISGASRGKRGFGHPRRYWKSDPMLQANEFFAELAALKAEGNTTEYELIRKFAPQSVKRFEEIFKDIINNKGKALEL